MKIEKLRTYLIFFLFLTLTITLFKTQSIQAASTGSVNATIKISVCGNNIKEGGEDCDNADLNNQTCQSIGYSTGTLSCDISCSFDTSACTAATPTPTPTITPTPAITHTPTPTPATASNNSPTATPTPTNTPTNTPTHTPTQQLRPLDHSPLRTLPTTLLAFDINGSGKIELKQLRQVIELWVTDWKATLTQKFTEKNNTSNEHKKCDINNDNTCDIKDLSVLLFYVEK